MEEKKTIWQQIPILNKRPEGMIFEEYKDKLKAQRDLYRMYRKHGISFKPVLTKKMQAAQEAYNKMVEAENKVRELIDKENATDTVPPTL